MKDKKITLHSETVYFAGIILISLAVAMTAAADFGISVIVAPAYILSQMIDFLSFGQSEYVIQSVLFVILCLLLKRIKVTYLCSFLTCIIYGAVLDLWRTVVPIFNADITPPGSMAMPIRILLFVLGMLLTSFSVALSFHTYLYPQVYDFFVKCVTKHFNLNLTKFKTGFDFCCFVIATAMTLIVFQKFVGIGIGTIVLTAFNGMLIGFFDKLFTKYLRVIPLSQKLEKAFEI